ncbi:hypothetical protein V1290_006464 [Bradyrhizobium sp. AZCC 1578]
MTFLRIVISLYLFDLSMISAQTRSRLSRWKTGFHFSGSCSRHDRWLAGSSERPPRYGYVRSIFA